MISIISAETHCKFTVISMISLILRRSPERPSGDIWEIIEIMEDIVDLQGSFEFLKQTCQKTLETYMDFHDV